MWPLGEIAQLVEHATENCGVLGSSPSLAIGKPLQMGVFPDSDRYPERLFVPVSVAVGTNVGTNP
jgi:hypothetical protein